MIPVVWLGWLHLKHKDPGLAWWWVAGVFVVSWLADTAALWMNPWISSKVYPVSQAAIIGLVFLSRREALTLIVTLMVIGTVDVLLVGIGDFDILLRTVAWLSIVGIIWPLRQLERLRISLLVAFGVGWVAWMGYSVWPGWTSWLIYQAVRLAGIALFCWASIKPGPRLTVLARINS